ncbi:MAG TPA: aldehyde dehydrogenase family protein [Burkholderiaceae bacterium]|nr:aldehyde dehydrogenase family protein [Burkholderiaceae bacterium]
MELQEIRLGTEATEADRVGQLIQKARSAQIMFSGMGQEALDDAVAAVGWAIMEPGRNRLLSERAVAETGLGNVADKIRKNDRKTLGLLRDLQGVITTGVIARDEVTGITEIARPVGVVAAITPSTNPAATPANKIINALKCGNAVIVAPSPKGLGPCQMLIGFIHEQFKKCGLPADLVQCLPSPITKAMTAELMRQADLVVATGSQSNVRMAYGCGTPAFGVGAGNVASIVDGSADVADAAAKIVASKTFDNATSCSSENSVVVVSSVYDAMLAALREQGAVLLTAAEKQRLQAVMWSSGKLSGAVTGKSAAEIADIAGLDLCDRIASDPLTVLLVEEAGFGRDHPFSGEKLSPVLTVYRAPDFDGACAMVWRQYAYMGAGHSVGLHTRDEGQAEVLGQALPVSRVIVNQAHCFATGGNFDNGLPFSLSMGCGTWGGNNFSDNMHYRHYMNITRVARRIPERKPTMGQVLGGYFERYGA